MIFVVVDNQGRSSSSPLALVRVGDDSVVGEMDDFIKWSFRTLPRFAHENQIDSLFNNKVVELIYLVVDRMRVNIHHSR